MRHYWLIIGIVFAALTNATANLASLDARGWGSPGQEEEGKPSQTTLADSNATLFSELESLGTEFSQRTVFQLAQGPAPLTVAGNGASSERWRIRIMSNIPERGTADSLKEQLDKDQFTPVDIVQQGKTYTVLVGDFPSERAAQQGLTELKTAGGYQPEAVQKSAPKPAAGGASAGSGPAKTWRVLVNSFDKSDDAEKSKEKMLTEDGYAGVEVQKEGSSFKLLMGRFPSKEDADRMCQQLHDDGYALAKALEVQEREQTAPAAAGTAAASPASGQLLPLPSVLKDVAMSDEERQLVQEYITAQDKINRGLANLDDHMRLKELSRRLESNPKLKEPLTRLRTDTKEKLNKLLRDFRNLFERKDIAGATKKFEEARGIDPTDSGVVLMSDLLENAKKGSATGPQIEAQQQANKLIADSNKAKEQGQLDRAIELAEQALRVDPQNKEAQALITDLKDIKSHQGTQTASTSGSSGLSAQMQNYLLIGGIAVVVLLLTISAFALLQNTRREKELIRQVQELATHSSDTSPPPTGTTEVKREPREKTPVRPSKAAPGKLMTTPLVLDTAQIFESGSDKASESSESMKAGVAAASEKKEIAAGESDVVSLHGTLDTHAPAPPVGSASPSPTTVRADSVHIEDLNIPIPTEGLSLPISEEEPPPFQSEEVSTMGGPLDIDLEALLKGDMFTERTAEEVSSASALVGDVPQAPPPMFPVPGSDPMSSSETLAFNMQQSTPPPSPRDSSSGFPMAAPPFPAVSATDSSSKMAGTSPSDSSQGLSPGANNGLYFEQTFEEETTGKQPRGWQGEYDYATLLVDDQSPAQGSGRCLKFEKRSGAGSANYVCQFPKASGRVIVEFDMRCDDKNKYLLGFYIEKDEDFKQSVHTIVHRTDTKSQPSLRIQGEPIPYELGTWRHIKYDLNLLAGLVNAFVDGLQVVKDAKLPTNPAYVNTLSIRDNLATVGVLLLDNIRIYKA